MEQDDALAYLVSRAAGSPHTSEQFVYGLLRESILARVLRPGMRLRQEEMAQALGVSRIPVRTALYRLQADGLVNLLPNRGAVVRVLSKSEVEEIYRLRLLLETEALRRSAPVLTGAKLASLEHMAARMDGLKDGPAFIDARSNFYRTLYDERANPATVQLIEQLRSMIGTQLLEYKFASEKHGHRALLTLLREGDAEGAVSWLRAHLEMVCSEVAAIAASR